MKIIARKDGYLSNSVSYHRVQQFIDSGLATPQHFRQLFT